MTKNIFITTTLPYPNSESGPHVGFLFEAVLADAISKWLKLKGESVFLNTGIDEEGLKIYRKAAEKGLTPIEYLDSVSPNYINFLKSFNIEYDNFYRTSSTEHSESVQIIWKRFYDRGDIYKKKYSCKYCVGCESFKSDSELVGNICPDHTSLSIELVEEDNYFFRLSKYKSNLEEWIKNSTGFLSPANKVPELLNLIDGIEDISISRVRKNCPWGTVVPGDDEQTVYIWFSALLNYIFAAGYLTDNFNWDNVIQTCGPDNIKHQALIFQAILASEGIKKSDKLLVHGTILDKDGRKISKTLGNVVDPIEQLEKFGVDAVRYYALAGLSTYSNSSWSEDDLKNIWNSEIVNDWGNLVSRTLHLIDIKSAGKITVVPLRDFADTIQNYRKEITGLWNEFKVKDALKKTNELVKFGNKYINDTKPWVSGDPYELSNLYLLLITVNEFYIPVFGREKCAEISKIIDVGKKAILFNRI